MSSALRSFSADHAFGKSSEITTFDLIKQLDPELELISHPYALFDYQSPNSYVELKTRLFEMARYPTTIVGVNKIKFAEEHPENDFYFCFRFTDGVFYSKYDAKVYSKFKKAKVERNDRGKCEKMEVIHIPIRSLVRIHPRDTDGKYTVHFK
jgi:hypothetical protein